MYKQLVIKNIKLFSYEELQENYNYLESYNEFITEKFKVDKNTDLEEMFFEYDQELASEVLEIVELSLKNQKVIYEYIELVPNKSISSLYSRLKKSKKVHNDLLETLQFNQLSNRQKKKIEKKNKKGIGFFGYLFLLDLLFSKKKKNKQTENTSTWKWKYYDDLTYDEETGTYVETDDE